MKSRIDPRSARIAVYAVAIAHRMEMSRADLDIVRFLAENPDKYEHVEEPHGTIVELASDFCDWSSESGGGTVVAPWIEGAKDLYPIEMLAALDHVRPLIQPMNQS